MAILLRPPPLIRDAGRHPNGGRTRYKECASLSGRGPFCERRGDLGLRERGKAIFAAVRDFCSGAQYVHLCSLAASHSSAWVARDLGVKLRAKPIPQYVLAIFVGSWLRYFNRLIPLVRTKYPFLMGLVLIRLLWSSPVVLISLVSFLKIEPNFRAGYFVWRCESPIWSTALVLAVGLSGSCEGVYPKIMTP